MSDVWIWKADLWYRIDRSDNGVTTASLHKIIPIDWNALPNCILPLIVWSNLNFKGMYLPMDNKRSTIGTCP